MTQGFMPGLRVVMADGSIAMLVPKVHHPAEIMLSARAAAVPAGAAYRLPVGRRLLDHV